MSGKISGAVWDMALPKEEKYILLAYADKADHEGYGVFPSYGLVAWMTGYTRRHVMRVVAKLEEQKIMVIVKSGGKGKHGTPDSVNEWRIDIDAAPKSKPRRKTRVPGDTGVTPPVTPESSPPVTPVSPDPSVVDPSSEHSKAATPRKRNLALDWIVTDVLHATLEQSAQDKTLNGLAVKLLSSVLVSERIRLHLQPGAPLSYDAQNRLAPSLPGLKAFWGRLHPNLNPDTDFPRTPPSFSVAVAQWYAAGCPNGDKPHVSERPEVLTYDPDCPRHCDHGFITTPDGTGYCECRKAILKEAGVRS